MEQTLHELNVDGLSMKLTSEKLYINSATSNETFGLRSLNGIGIVDLVDKYNQELSEFKQKTQKPWAGIAIATFLGLILGFLNLPERNELTDFNKYFLVIALFLFGLAFYLYNKNSSLIVPTLQSAVRIMISGASRDFVFDKNSSQAGEVSKFVALVEDTLTSYHRN